MYKIQNITSKEVNTKIGMKPVYSVQVDGEWYGHGFRKPAFKIGDEVAFTFTDGTYGKKIDEGSVRVIKEGDASAAPPASVAPARPFGPPAKPFPIPPLHGDRAIVRQNALTNAREAVAALGKYRDEDEMRDDEYANRIIAMARMFEAYSCGDLDLQEAMATTPINKE